MKSYFLSCPVCNSLRHEILFPGFNKSEVDSFQNIVLCEDCGSVFRNPIIPELNRTHYQKPNSWEGEKSHIDHSNRLDFVSRFISQNVKLGARDSYVDIGGGQLGYDLQVSDRLLAGIETDVQGLAGANNNAAAVTLSPTPLSSAGLNLLTSVASGKSLDFLGTVRARLGYLVTPTLLAYATGGLAYGHATSTTSFFQHVPNDFPGFLLIGASQGRFSDMRLGWTAGGGLEWMFWPQWSAKIEYLFYDLGVAAYPVAIATDWQLTNLLVASATQARARFDCHVVRAGVNYHFNWGVAPVVAKY